MCQHLLLSSDESDSEGTIYTFSRADTAALRGSSGNDQSETECDRERVARLSRVAEGLVHLASKKQVRGSNPRLCKVLDESRSFFRVHTGYFSNIPKCIKQSSSPVGDVLSPVLYRAPSVRINLIVCLIELCTSFELRDKFGGSAGYNYVKRG
ncbi:down syndrome cell adhesion molecule-like protein Dscam2 [Trichonephila clavipes]|nr:down syndrome cell adhesion molecule-like protein Dscam2 [Trichonephila clavipes]